MGPEWFFFAQSRKDAKMILNFTQYIFRFLTFSRFSLFIPLSHPPSAFSLFGLFGHFSLFYIFSFSAF
jgi:hypothetical protein